MDFVALFRKSLPFLIKNPNILEALFVSETPNCLTNNTPKSFVCLEFELYLRPQSNHNVFRKFENPENLTWKHFLPFKCILSRLHYSMRASRSLWKRMASSDDSIILPNFRSLVYMKLAENLKHVVRSLMNTLKSIGPRWNPELRLNLSGIWIETFDYHEKSAILKITLQPFQKSTRHSVRITYYTK